MNTKPGIAVLVSVVCAFATGCVKDVNSPSSVPQEPAAETAPSSEPGTAGEQAGGEDSDVALPAPEVVENGKDGELIAARDVQPEAKPEPTPVTDPNAPVEPDLKASDVKQPEYAPLTDDKWDIKLPEVELKPGDPKAERTKEVEKKLAKALADIEAGDLDFLEGHTSNRMYDQSGARRGNVKVKKVSKPSGGRSTEAKSAPMMMMDASAEAPAMKAAAPKAAEKYNIGRGNVFATGGIAEADLPPTAMNTDEYSQYDPNRFINTAANPLSTFGADVDTASYGVFRRAINEGRAPRNQGLRVEEMINYFKYDYPNPKAGEPFSVTTEIAGCPWNKDTKLMLVGAKTRELNMEERPASNIVFLLDISGSMRGHDRLALIKASIISMLPKLTAQDRISIVTYSGAERFIIDGVPGDHHATIMKALTLFDADGVTNGEAGIKMAYAVAKKNYIKGGNNRIIMGTDGDLNVGISNTNELKSLIEKKRASGIFLSVLGVGMGNYKDNRLEALADYGNGSYHYIDTLREGRRVLVDEFMSTVFVAAKDVKFQVDFNPGKIKGYRQIGYETRKLNAEDFADDKKDGGEVGAGHQVTILYEIVETGSAVEVPEPSSKYQKVEAVKSDEYATVKLRYKKPDGDVSTELSWPVNASSVRSTMSNNMNFASAVAATAMILNNSPFKGTATYDSILGQLKGISSLDSDEYRAEFVALVRRLKGL
ncbi:MAG: von Willebrand factor type A domain-containing protein [Proteobacteria bacterium]|nr:von Willebrand factor type A domain-containing protein [Pseudomonadota bacterium]